MAFYVSHKTSVWKANFLQPWGPQNHPLLLRILPAFIHRFWNRNYSFASVHPSCDNCETNFLEPRWHTHKSFQEKWRKIKNWDVEKIMRNHLAKHWFLHLDSPQPPELRRLCGEKSLGLGRVCLRGRPKWVGSFPLKDLFKIPLSLLG